MTTTPAAVQSIYRYPVKGLSPQRLERTRLTVGQTIPADRFYAVENGPCGFDPATPAYFPKHRFLMLMRNERLAALRTDFDEVSHTLSVRFEDREAVRADLRRPEGRIALETFFEQFMPDELRGPPKVLTGAGHSFSDVARKVVSIINLASVAEIEGVSGAPLDPLRFRGNLLVTGWPAWQEFELMGKSVRIGGSARLKIVKRIQRCAATEVDPVTGIRDLPIPRTLMDNFGHADCGVYAEVTAAGDIATGDSVLVDWS